jgi:23S rRNA (uracil1939-C5)-methyltransferase
MAARGATVTAVEEDRQAIEDLKANAKLNRIPPGRVKGIAARVEEVLARIGRDSWDAVVLDPPRSGCAPAVLAAVFNQITPARAVYVSCNPEALGRELPGILKSGYGIDRVQAIDMFPHTEHIETVVVLRRMP